MAKIQNVSKKRGYKEPQTKNIAKELFKFRVSRTAFEVSQAIYRMRKEAERDRNMIRRYMKNN